MGVMRGIYRRTWYASQMLLHAAAQAVLALRRDGVRPMLIRGIALLASHPEDIGTRPVNVIDLLIAPRERGRALTRLRALGWVRQPPGSAAERLRAWDRVDLMRGPEQRLTLHLSTALIPEHVRGLWRETVVTTVRDVQTLAPSSAEQLRLACAPTRARWAPPPLRWIPDAALIIRSPASSIDHRRLRARAEQGGSGAELDAALGYLKAEFGLGLASRASATPRPGATRSMIAIPRGRLDLRRVESFRRLALEGALAELMPALEAGGVRPLLIKGAAFASWLYDDPRERSYGDIDLLVAPDRFAAAEAVLSELGYEPLLDAMRDRERPDHTTDWMRTGLLPLVVELHHTMVLLPGDPSLIWQRLSEGALRLELGGTSVSVPTEPVAALIVGLHAAQHGRSHERSMRDLHLALERVDHDAWRAAARLADSLDAAANFAAGLRLDPAGEELCGRLGLTSSAPRHVRLRATTPPRTAMGIEQLVTTPGALARLRLLIEVLVPSRARLLATSPLAGRGSLGLACAYLWRPLQLLRALPRGLRAWSRAASDQSGDDTNM
jgi:hypothetical protein